MPATFGPRHGALAQECDILIKSKRLQVLLGDEEFEEFRALARKQGLTLSEWTRQVLRRARTEQPQGDRARKLAAVRAAARHSFPTGDIEAMLEEIERGYGGR